MQGINFQVENLKQEQKSKMASNMNHQIITDIDIINTLDTNNSTVPIQEKSNVTQEEQDNINNMNANHHHSTTSNVSTNHRENNDNSNSVNNNHMNEEDVEKTENNTNANNLNNGQCQSNGNVTTELMSVPEKTNQVTTSQDCDKTDDTPMSNALSDLMNTYSSDEDMFENFRSKPEFDDPKSEDELSSSTSFLSIHESENR